MIELNIIKTKQLEMKRKVEYELTHQDDLKDMIFIIVRDMNKIVIMDKSEIIGHIELSNQYISSENMIRQFSKNIIEYDTYKDILSSKVNYIIENYLLTVE